MPGHGAPVLSAGDTYTVSDTDFAKMQAAGLVGTNLMIVDLGFVADAGAAAPAVQDTRAQAIAPRYSETTTAGWDLVNAFAFWLSSHGNPTAKGCITEIGVGSRQDATKWAETLHGVLQACDTNQYSTVPYFLWSCRESPTNGIAVYGSDPRVMRSGPLNTAWPSALAFEQHLTDAAGNARPVGVNFEMGVVGYEYVQYAATRPVGPKNDAYAFATDDTSVSVLPPYPDGGEYSYGRHSSWKFIASRGVKYVRLALQWERMCRSDNPGVIDATELGRLDQALGWAQESGIKVVIDLHNFGQYVFDNNGARNNHYIGDGTLTQAMFNSFWTSLADHYKNGAGSSLYSTIYGYEIMNEPSNMGDNGVSSLTTQQAATNWETISNSCVQAIRTIDPTMLCFISAYNYANPGVYGFLHTNTWVKLAGGGDDPNIRYVAHLYLDSGSAGAYSNPYDIDQRYWRGQGYVSGERGDKPQGVATHAITVPKPWESPWSGKMAHKIVRVTGIAANANPTVYTVPFGRVAIINAIHVLSGPAGNAGNVKVYFVPNGQAVAANSNWVVQENSATVANGMTFIQTPGVLATGDKIYVTNTVGDQSVHITVLELPDDSIVPFKASAPANVDTVLFTCPTGKRARLLSTGFGVGSGLGIFFRNPQAANSLITMRFAPNGGAYSNMHVFTLNAYSSSGQVNFYEVPLQAGDKLAINPSVGNINVWGAFEVIG